MSDTPTVSVLMTIYNRERYVAQAIESVLASTFRDFELVVVDDGSKDKSFEIAQRYIGDARVKLHRNEKNLGQFENRNHAASLGRGKYLKYLDSDDYIYPHGLEVMVSCMERFPEAGIGLARKEEIGTPYPVLLSPEEVYRKHFSGNGFLSNAPTSSIYRADAFRAVDGFLEGYHYGDSQLLLKLCARFPTLLLPPGLTWWRAHEDQANALQQKDLVCLAQYFHEELKALESEDCPLQGADRERAISWLKGLQVRKLARLGTKNPGAVAELFRESGLVSSDIRYLFRKPR
jgi:glycosyltransferase involved in cell wall biosynthesis